MFFSEIHDKYFGSGSGSDSDSDPDTDSESHGEYCVHMETLIRQINDDLDAIENIFPRINETASIETKTEVITQYVDKTYIHRQVNRPQNLFRRNWNIKRLQ